jgi:hypothetical protein
MWSGEAAHLLVEARDTFENDATYVPNREVV